jgi:hypothetical protein
MLSDRSAELHGVNAGIDPKFPYPILTSNHLMVCCLCNIRISSLNQYWHGSIKPTIACVKWRFSVHATVYNLFNLGRHLISANYYRLFRMRVFGPWKNAVV